MSLMSQPLPAPQAASPTPPTDGEAARLLALWASLACRAAAAAAHGSEDEMSLLHSQLQVEEALTDRGLLNPEKLAELTAWEATLIHEDPHSTPRSCLICRKALLQLPLDLPLPAPVGGRR